MIAPAFAPPRLTRLELHGFKSFATKTVFAFEPGITAIVGPNGSGKSNISDAVRWALGEQSHGALRSKKTEDVIFAGGQGRSPAGMAEVAVTFDNSTAWLPTEFSEVTVTRRAYRSGENQYLINGKRVRLKDVTHLTASLGQSHTVVGQGLVDSALSQRADERRGLFEHAADLTGLRMKAVEAERSLIEAEANSARIADLLLEVEPRVRALERAAKQAKEWKGVHDRLRDLQRVHYGRLLEDAQAWFEATEAAAAGDETKVARCQAEVKRLSGAIAAARFAAEEARETLAQHAAQYQSTLDQTRRVSHERDLAAERQAALARRREDLLDIQTGLDEQVAGVVAGLVAIAAAIAAAETEVADVRRTVEAKQAARTAARAARADVEKRGAKLLTTISEGERTLADLGRRRALLEQRRETDAAERERAARAIAERTSRIAGLETELVGFDAAEQEGARELASLDDQLIALAKGIAEATAAANAARVQVAECERELGQATTRLDVLQKLQASGTGLFAGVRAVMQAVRAGKLGGVRGTVVEVIEAPANLDTAIEVALGGHLQDIVVERWADAEAAIAFLQQGNAGRATFQPLDTVRASNNRSLPGGLTRSKGVIGLADELVSVDPDLKSVVGALLGRTLVVEDLPAARATLKQLPPGWSAVTLSGEITRTGGSVTGGAAVRESGMLSRERELRDLPRQIEQLSHERDQAVAAQKAAADEPRRLSEERQGVAATRAGLVASRKERQAQRARIAGWLADLRNEQKATEARQAILTESSTRIAHDLTGITNEQAQAESRLAEMRADYDAVQQELNQDADVGAAADRELAHEQRQLVALDERLRAERRREMELLAHQATLAEETATRHERLAQLDGERAAVAAQHKRLAQELAALTATRTQVEAERPPLEAATRAAESSMAQFDKALEAAHEALLAAQRAHGSRGVEVERARGELATIRQRIVDDLDLADAELLLDRPLPEEREQIAPDEAEREIGRLKDRLRRVGYVGENAVEEYEREAERHAFLRTQLDDVEGAAAALHGLLGDLHAKMRERFDETFALVSTAFTETFTALFGGGTARLMLVAGDEGDGEAAGIDIVAQPPGKRLQSLALLSGGERALTAAALLFAILTVNPTPFCLLDEVDAALDEANVVRFREQLQALAAETQAIIITHNRGTIEIADTLYGVSMRDDGVSQVLSLRLTEAIAVAE
ncbi:MAG: chromosome segregation protein SMC [Thermomicrobiales bacterium]